MRRILKWTAFGLLGLLVVAVLGLIGGRYWLASEGGRDFLAGQAASAGVELNGVGGDPLGRLTVERARVLDADGAWLTIEDAVVDWRPWALVSRRIEVTEIIARRVTVDRPPAADAEAEPASDGAFSPPNIRLSLNRLKVDEIVLAEPLLGMPAALSLDAMARYAKGAADAQLEVRRLDGPGEASLDAKYALGENAFDIDLTVNEPAGGLATKMLGLADGLNVRLDGAGDLSGWTGVLVAATGQARLADLKLKADRADGTVRMRIEGPLAPSPLLPAEARPLVGETVGVLIVAAAAEDGSKASIERLSITAAAGDVSAEARVDLGTGALSAKLRTTRIGQAALAALAPDIDIGAPSLRVDADGTLDAPNARITLQADGVRAGPAALQGVRAVAAATGVTGSEIAWTLEAAVAEASLGDPALDPVLAGGWSIDAKGAADLAGGKFPIEASVRSGDGLAARFEGAATATGAVAGQITADVEDLRLIAGLAGVPLTGPGAVSASAAFSDAGLALDEIAVEGVGARVTGTLKLDAGFERIDGAFNLAAPDLARIGRIVAAPIGGAMTGDVTLTGPVADPTAQGVFAFRRLSAAGQTFSTARLRFAAQTLASGPKGKVDLGAQSSYGPTSAATEFAMQGQRLQLSRLTASAPGAGVAGDLSVNLASGLATGDIALDLANLAEAGRAFGLDISGAGQGRVTLKPDKIGQEVDANLRLQNVAGFGISAKTIDLTANGGVDGKGSLSARLDVTTLVADGASAEAVRLTLNGPLTGADIKLTASGAAGGEPFEAAIAGQLAITDNGQRFQLASASGEFSGEDIRIAKGLTATNDPDGARLSGLDLSMAGVTLAADASLVGEQVSLVLKRVRADLDGLASVIPSLPASGRIEASGQIAGTLSNPQGRISITGRDLAVVQYQERHEFSFDSSLALQNRSLAIDVAVLGLGDQPIRSGGTVGLVSGGNGGPPIPGPTSPLNLTLAWNGPLAPLTAIAAMVDHRLTGTGAVDLRVGGTIGRPDVNGSILLADGSYEHLEFGTRLEFQRIEVLAQGDRIELTPFTAKAGAGTISASASAVMDGERGYPFAFNANLANALLTARDDVTASASGEIKVESGTEGVDVFARIVTDRVEVELIDNLPASIPTLQVTEVGPLPAGRKAPAETSAGGGPPIRLDVEVNVPGRFFVRGRGLESEWQGDVAVTGTADAPVVNGVIKLKRGAFDLVGKRLDLTTGNVRLEPNASGEIEAVVDILAEYEGADFSVAARVEGPATDPKLILSSTPELPRDEILSRLLFNKNAGALTAEESLQLAVAAASLTSGGGGGFDPVGEIRRATGIDELRVDVGGEAGPAVEAGKYLTDDIYVGVRQGAAAGTGAVTVEVEVFDNITLESEAAQDGSQKVGARLKWDY